MLLQQGRKLKSFCWKLQNLDFMSERHPVLPIAALDRRHPGLTSSNRHRLSKPSS